MKMSKNIRPCASNEGMRVAVSLYDCNVVKMAATSHPHDDYVCGSGDKLSLDTVQLQSAFQYNLI